MDTEGGHYASKFVNIAKGSYEGQLVIGDSFVHPIKEFTVSEGSDIIVLHFKFCKGTHYVKLLKGSVQYDSEKHNCANTYVSIITFEHYETCSVFRDHLYSKTTWSCPNCGFTMHFYL